MSISTLLESDGGIVAREAGHRGGEALCGHIIFRGQSQGNVIDTEVIATACGRNAIIVKSDKELGAVTAVHAEDRRLAPNGLVKGVFRLPVDGAARLGRMNVASIALDSEFHAGVITGKLSDLAIAQIHGPELQVINHIGLDILHPVLKDFLVAGCVVGGMPVILVAAIAIDNQEPFVTVGGVLGSSMANTMKERYIIVVIGI